eukprot:TRINITY_DN14845_c0_g1_i2.p1 TRINITY_DN14845_c0_g1~~TRINITY_DN14845_c0_g1_i2.p1  ORF type:complete len:370 (-),score=120.02 TRINITY_DN14845_c0_g1_i2:46-1155(-)
MLLSGQWIVYSGDPLRDLDFISFLDRFSFKTPKKDLKLRSGMYTTNPKSGSIMQSMYVPYSERAEPVDSSSFIDQDKSKVREDELFFYQYFKVRSNLPTLGKTKHKKAEPQSDKAITEDEVDQVMEDELNSDFWDDEDGVGDELFGGLDEDEDDEDTNEAKKGKEVKAKLTKGGVDEKRRTNGDDDEDSYDYADLKSSDFDEDGEDSTEVKLFNLVSDDDADEPALDGEEVIRLDQGSKIKTSGIRGDIVKTSRNAKKGGDEDFDDDGEDGEDGDDDIMGADDENMPDDFASLDEFAHLLETSGSSGVHPKQLAHESGSYKGRSVRRSLSSSGRDTGRKRRRDSEERKTSGAIKRPGVGPRNMKKSRRK